MGTVSANMVLTAEAMARIDAACAGMENPEDRTFASPAQPAVYNPPSVPDKPAESPMPLTQKSKDVWEDLGTLHTPVATLIVSKTALQRRPKGRRPGLLPRHLEGP